LEKYNVLRKLKKEEMEKWLIGLAVIVMLYCLYRAFDFQSEINKQMEEKKKRTSETKKK